MCVTMQCGVLRSSWSTLTSRSGAKIGKQIFTKVAAAISTETFIPDHKKKSQLSAKEEKRGAFIQPSKLAPHQRYTYKLHSHLHRNKPSGWETIVSWCSWKAEPSEIIRKKLEEKKAGSEIKAQTFNAVHPSFFIIFDLFHFLEM